MNFRTLEAENLSGIRMYQFHVVYFCKKGIEAVDSQTLIK